MNCESSQSEVRERFSESSSLLSNLRAMAPPPLTPLDQIQKAMRGLWIVSLYAAFERSANVIVEATISEINEQRVSAIECHPSVNAVFNHGRAQAIKGSGWPALLDKAHDFADAVLSSSPLELVGNPLAEKLQNVDGSTLEWAARMFGEQNFRVEGADIGRLSTTRERRNAVAHGRESAAEVGQRYELDELQRLYEAADSVATAFLFAMREHCRTKTYLRAA